MIEDTLQSELVPDPEHLVSYRNDLGNPYVGNGVATLYVPSPDESAGEERLDVSIVIPLLNEEDCIELLHSQISGVLSGLGRTYEIIFVDDGSTDGSFSILKRLCQYDARVRVIRLRRNFGQTAAFTAGFDHARGDLIITLDGDLQNDPADIPKMLDGIDAGFDIVSGWRVDRKDPFLQRRLPSFAANWLISQVTGVRLHDYGCSFKAYRREVVENIHLYGEMHRFIPALASSMGVRIAELPVRHEPRRFGRSKYGLDRILKVLLDLMTVKFLLHYSTRPIQIFGLMGLMCLGVGVTLGVYLSTLRLFFGEPLAERPLLLLAVLLIILGMQLMIMGLLGEFVMRTYYEVQHKPIYMVRDMLGTKRDQPSPSHSQIRN